MPMLKPMAGHSTDMTAAGFYYMYNKDENGKRSPEAGVRAIAFDGINISLVSPLDPDKDWWDVMNDTRERFGNNAPHGERAARTYEHFMISPDPRDNVALDDFRQYVRQWATHFFDSKLIGDTVNVFFTNRANGSAPSAQTHFHQSRKRAFAASG